MKLRAYLDQSERGRAAELAREINSYPPDISDWANEKKQVPTHRASAIEKATNGKVHRKDMRPNDWHIHWPELVESRAA